jgi:hypothetical protein
MKNEILAHISENAKDPISLERIKQRERELTKSGFKPPEISFYN